MDDEVKFCDREKDQNCPFYRLRVVKGEYVPSCAYKAKKDTPKPLKNGFLCPKEN